MKKQNFAICDLETTYAYKLMEYMTGRQKIPFEVLVFGETQSLRVFAKEHPVDLLLISARMMCEELRHLGIGKILILTEGEFVEEYRDYPSVYKYQASDRLLREVMNYCAKETAAGPVFASNERARILGVYSPVKRCGKTCFALTLGQILAQKQSVLYINLEDYAGFEQLLHRESAADLSDVMYFIRQKQGNLMYKLQAVIGHIGKLAYIPPAFSSADLREVRTDEWLTLLREITCIGGYETVILDLGEAVEEKMMLLAECSRIYSPIASDAISGAKLAQYEKLVQEMDYDELLERTEYLQLPYVELAEDEYGLEQLVRGEMGDFVCELLEKGTTGI